MRKKNIDDSVAGWMSSNVATARLDETLSAAQKRMNDGDFRSLPVVEQGRLIGIITDRDLRSHSEHPERATVESAMSELPVTVTPATPLREAARLLFEPKIGALPVLQDKRLVGVITTQDILRAFLKQD
jgi:acetoin utilization protein AcuB